MDIQTINTDALGFRIVDVQDDFIIVHKASGLGFHDESALDHDDFTESSLADSNINRTPKGDGRVCQVTAPKIDLQAGVIQLDFSGYLNKVNEERIKTTVGLCNRLNALLSCDVFEFTQKRGVEEFSGAKKSTETSTTSSVSGNAEESSCGLNTVATGQLNGRVFPVHRLDKPTSGLLVFARSAVTAAELSSQFASNSVKKIYIALSDKKPKKKQGAIVGDMVKSRRSAWKLLKSKENPARTSFMSSNLAPNLRLFTLTPKTGRTHQLRVAMKSLGAPILGDTLYGGSKEPRSPLFLHAASLAFQLKGRPYDYQQVPDLAGVSLSEDAGHEPGLIKILPLSGSDSETFSFDWSFDETVVQDAVSSAVNGAVRALATSP